MIYTDIFNIKHENAKVVDTHNSFNRIFVIENTNGVRYTCLRENAPVMPKSATHFKTLRSKNAPLNYLSPYFTGKRVK